MQPNVCIDGITILIYFYYECKYSLMRPIVDQVPSMYKVFMFPGTVIYLIKLYTSLVYWELEGYLVTRNKISTINRTFSLNHSVCISPELQLLLNSLYQYYLILYHVYTTSQQLIPLNNHHYITTNIKSMQQHIWIRMYHINNNVLLCKTKN